MARANYLPRILNPALGVGRSFMIGLAAVSIVAAFASNADSEDETKRDTSRVQATALWDVDGAIYPAIDEQIRQLEISAVDSARADSLALATRQFELSQTPPPAQNDGPSRKPSRKSQPPRVSRSGGGPKASAESPSHRLGPAWTLPVTGFQITARYGQPGPWASGMHTGVDFGVPSGSPVHAVGAGVVVVATFDGAYGNNTIIRHPDGIYTQYAHLSRIDVKTGQTVMAGQSVGRSGATGNVTGPHLHFETRTTPVYGSAIDPIKFLRSHGVNV
ncbi:M23 family metallopeptidase [Streptomyces chartreusis]|uniref:M23 family metallopeptidase n=1 Tax=Streptomyces chartreusis TaxID=1969 RepID=UPI00367A9337